MAFQTIGTGSLRMRTVGRQGMRRPSAMGGVCNVFRPGAAAHGWRALPFPLAPFRSHTGSGRGDVGGWRESLLARARNGRRCTVRASCNIRVFDQALRNPPLPLPGTGMNADRGTQLQASVPRCAPGCAPGCAGLRPACAMSRGNLSADASATITYQVPVPQLLLLAG